jgi:hypothetical protein
MNQKILQNLLSLLFRMNLQIQQNQKYQLSRLNHLIQRYLNFH